MLANNMTIVNSQPDSRPPAAAPTAATTKRETATNRCGGWVKISHPLYEISCTCSYLPSQAMYS